MLFHTRKCNSLSAEFRVNKHRTSFQVVCVSCEYLSDRHYKLINQLRKSVMQPFSGAMKGTTTSFLKSYIYIYIYKNFRILLGCFPATLQNTWIHVLWDIFLYRNRKTKDTSESNVLHPININVPSAVCHPLNFIKPSLFPIPPP